MKTEFDLEIERVESEVERLGREEARFIGGLLLVAFGLMVAGFYFA